MIIALSVVGRFQLGGCNLAQVKTVADPLWVPHPALSTSVDFPGSGAKGLLPVSCSPGPRKPLAVEKAVGISCEWVAGEPDPPSS